MYTLFVFFTSNAHQIFVEAVGIERCYRRHQFSDGYQTGVKGLVSGYLVSFVFAFPETAAWQAHIPVTEVFLYKIRNSTGSASRLIIGIEGIYFFDERIEFWKYPAVYFWAFSQWYIGFCISETVGIGIERKEWIGVVERTEELTAHLSYPFQVKFEVVPRVCVWNHIPASGIGAILGYGSERVYRIAQAFRHLLSVLVKHQSVRHYVFVRHTVEYRSSNGVKRIEPTACLVYPFRNKVGWVSGMVFYIVLVFKRIVPLCIRHRPRVEPYVDKVGFAVHWLAWWRYEHYVIYDIFV